MSKRSNPVLAWNAPKRRKTMSKPKITMSQLPPSVKPEIKFSDRQVLDTSTVNELQVRPDGLSVAQGDDGDQMTGSDCFLKGVDYTLRLPSTGWNICRVSVIVARDPSITPAALNPALRYGHREFQVLHDEVFSINERNHCHIKKKLDMKQKWNLTGTVITENNVYIMANLDSSVSHLSIARLYFTDP